MRVPIKANITYAQAGITILILTLLSVFCEFVNFSLIIPFLLLFCGVHLFLFRKASTSLFLQLGLLIAIVIFATFTLTEYSTVSSLYLPLAGISMLTMLLFNDLQLVFIMSFVTSMIVGLILGGVGELSSIDLMLIFFIGNLIGAYSIRDARTRGKLMESGFNVSIIQVLALMLLHHDMDFMISKEFAMEYVRPLMVNGILSAFVVMGTLRIFEFLFGVLTNFSLLELSDKDQPLLKKMSLEAPGTYHHSMVVSDLSEAAAASIGANSLLTRVGAYYHDIGKLIKPEYFTENQLLGINKHDTIEPSMSRLVILNHIKEGVDLGKKNKLNAVINEFVSQHHGTSLVYYFYQKALEEAEDETSIKEENYRYPGPKPQSRETAIVLMADSVEGASRSLDEPSPKKIEELVRKIINNKFIDGQLDECNLTLKEIDLIAETFARVLSAMYHSRVKYPDKKELNNRQGKEMKNNEL